MSTSAKILVTLGFASSALVTAWLLTGNRKEKTKQFVAKRAYTIKDALKSEKVFFSDEQEFYYI